LALLSVFVRRGHFVQLVFVLRFVLFLALDAFAFDVSVPVFEYTKIEWIGEQAAP